MEKNIKSYLTFKIGSELFGANVRNIQNIIEYIELTRVPDMPEYIIGITNLRGEVLPVVDSRIKLGINASKDLLNTVILVLETEFEGIISKTGLLVDEVSEVLEIAEENIKEAPSIGSKFKTEIITGVYSVDDKFIMLLDMNKVLYSKELLNVQE